MATDGVLSASRPDHRNVSKTSANTSGSREQLIGLMKDRVAQCSGMSPVTSPPCTLVTKKLFVARRLSNAGIGRFFEAGFGL